MKAVTIDEFFEERLVENLAALLGIDKSKIRVMNVISAGGARRRRAVDEMVADVEIGDPPAPTIDYEQGDFYDNSTLTNATEGIASNYTGQWKDNYSSFMNRYCNNYLNHNFKQRTIHRSVLSKLLPKKKHCVLRERLKIFFI